MRFPEFEEEWVNKRLEEIALIERGRFSPRPRNNPIFYGGDIPFVQTSDIVNSNGKIDSYSQTLNKKGLSVSKLFPKGTILITIAANIGYSGVLQKDMACPDSLIGLKCQNDVYNWFLNILLEIQQPKMEYLATSAAQKNINIEFLKPYSFNIPNLFEQKKIATFISAINERIQTQNKIIEELKLLKNTLSKKIFSCQLKFKDDRGNDFPEWILKELAEVMSVPEKIKVIDIDKNKLLSVKLHLKGVLKNENTDTLSIGATNYFIRKKGQFIYGKQNLFNGAFDIIPEELDGFISSGDVPTLEIKHSKIDALYLLYFLGRVNFYKKLEDLATGTGSKRIHETTLLSVKVEFPSLEEQTKIANFLLFIDTKKDIEYQILQELKEQKKYLLTNLFI